LLKLHGAVDNIEVIKDIIEKVEEKGFDNVFLVGTGGTYSMVSPLAYMLKTNFKSIHCHFPPKSILYFLFLRAPVIRHLFVF